MILDLSAYDLTIAIMGAVICTFVSWFIIIPAIVKMRDKYGKSDRCFDQVL